MLRDGSEVIIDRVHRTDGRGVGLARYIRDGNDPEVAEIAVTVADDWHGRGLGTELLHRIMERASEEGVP